MYQGIRYRVLYVSVLQYERGKKVTVVKIYTKKEDVCRTVIYHKKEGGINLNLRARVSSYFLPCPVVLSCTPKPQTAYNIFVYCIILYLYSVSMLVY